MSNKAYEIITERIIKKLESSIIPWAKFMEKRFLTIEETADFLNMSCKHLRNLVTPRSKRKLTINGHEIKPLKVNKMLRFDRLQIEKYVNEN